jgi:Ca2+-binding EF-hand superfamily protein
MMSIISLLLLSLLFLAGFLNLFFRFPTNKLFHAWFKHSTPTPDTKSSSPVSPRKERSPSPHNKAELKRVFATFDKNGDGFITKEELRESLRNIRIFMTEKEAEEMVAKVDANGDGLIEFDEFCMLYESMAGEEAGEGGGGGKEEGGGRGGEEELKEAFDVFDKDRDGLITVEELGVVLCALGMKEGKKAEDCKEMITKVDMDGDGMVNFDEFKRMMKGGSLLLAAH